MTTPVTLDGQSLAISDVAAVAIGRAPVALAEAARGRIGRAQAIVADLVERNAVAYGVTTGFGKLSDVAIPHARLAELQVNLVRSHAAGVGPLLPEREVRAMMLLRANVIAKGYSGARADLADLLIAMLNAGLYPPSAGTGERRGERRSGAARPPGPLPHRRGGSAPWRSPGAIGRHASRRGAGAGGAGAEGGADAHQRHAGAHRDRGPGAHRCAQTLARSARRRRDDAGRPARHAGGVRRADPGGARPGRTGRRRPGCCANSWRDSEIRESHRTGDPRVQDAYALRCMPQVHGPVFDAMEFAGGLIARELNAATDNPLVFDDGTLLSGGNFHGQAVAMALDVLAIALTNLATISERRIDRLVHPDLNQGLPPFLSSDAGVNSGFMMAQVTAAALTSECKVLAHPASVDTIPTDGNKEDVVPMAMTAALEAAPDRAQRPSRPRHRTDVRGAGARLPARRCKPGRGVAEAHRAVRALVPPPRRRIACWPETSPGWPTRSRTITSLQRRAGHDRHVPRLTRSRRPDRAPYARRAARRSPARAGSRKPRCGC